MSLFDYLGPFLLLLGPLVVVHELGHFALAKWFGVKVERFSVGFGPAIARRRLGETEYVLAWLPLGGYVKMAGESPDEEVPASERERGFNAQSPLRRIAIALAGPGMNLVLSPLVLAVVFMTGFPTITTLIGEVQPDSPAAVVGLRAHDRIVAVDGREVWRFDDLSSAVRRSGGQDLELLVERGENQIPVRVTPTRRGGVYQIGVIPGVPSATFAVPESDSPAHRAGLLSGDRVLALGGTAIRSWNQFAEVLEQSSGPIEIEVQRGIDPREPRVITTVRSSGDAPWTAERLGVMPLAFRIRNVQPGGAAERAGLLAGDVPLLLDGRPVQDLEEFRKAVTSSQGARLLLRVARGSERVDVELYAAPVEERVNGETVVVHRVGIELEEPLRVAAELREHQVRNPISALWMGTTQTASLLVLIVDSIRALVTREVGIENLAGPIGIGKIAGDAFREGWFQFLWIMCVISIHLAILNLLPIPVLDGGHIVFALMEAVRGGPVGMRAREIAQTVGISFVILLMGFAFWNDISRSWTDIVGWFKSLI